VSPNPRITNANLSLQILNESYIRDSLRQQSWDRSSSTAEREFVKMCLAWVKRKRERATRIELAFSAWDAAFDCEGGSRK
jgi:hypothetical protein